MSDTNGKKGEAINSARRKFLVSLFPKASAFNAVEPQPVLPPPSPTNGAPQHPSSAAPVTRTRRDALSVLLKTASIAVGLWAGSKIKAAYARDFLDGPEFPLFRELAKKRQAAAQAAPSDAPAESSQGRYHAQVYPDKNNPDKYTVLMTDKARSFKGKPFSYRVDVENHGQRIQSTTQTIVNVEGADYPIQVRFSFSEKGQLHLDAATFDSSVPAFVRKNVSFTKDSPEIKAIEHDTAKAVNMANTIYFQPGMDAARVQGGVAGRAHESVSGPEHSSDIFVERKGRMTTVRIGTTFRHPNLPPKGLPVAIEFSARDGYYAKFDERAYEMQKYLANLPDSRFRDLGVNRRLLVAKAVLATLMVDMQKKVGGGPGPVQGGFFTVYGQPFVEAPEFSGPAGQARLNALTEMLPTIFGSLPKEAFTPAATSKPDQTSSPSAARREKVKEESAYKPSAYLPNIPTERSKTFQIWQKLTK